MAEQDPKELSMDEILASIRNILQETSGEGTPRPLDDEDDVFELSPAMMLEEKQNREQNEVPLFGPQENLEVPDLSDVSVPSPALDKAVPAAPAAPLPFGTAIVTEKAVAGDETISRTPAIAEEVRPKPQKVEVRPTAAPAAPAFAPRRQAAASMIKSFAQLFEEQTAATAPVVSQFDAGKLLEQIVRNAVSDKINDQLLNAAVKEKIVPVLDSWLKMYLPQIVKQEVERVMAKDGKR